MAVVGVLLAAGAPAVAFAAGAADVPPSLPKPLVLPGAPGAGVKAGSLAGSAGVSPQGQFTYSIPLDVPRGRGGVEPRLSLGYSSGGGDGVFGLGWSLSGTGSAITRCGKERDTEGTRSGVHFDENDRFCLDGAKLIAAGTGKYGGDSTEYFTKEESFAKIVSVNSSGDLKAGPDRFVVFTKDGRIRTYEARTATRLTETVDLTEDDAPVPVPDIPGCADDASTLGDNCFKRDQHPAPSNRVVATDTPRVSWVLESEKNRSGDEMRFSYSRLPNNGTSGNEFVLSNIKYTYGTGREAQRTVSFEYEDRADKSFSFVNGVQMNLTQRVKAIKMIAPNPGAPSMVRQYIFKYLGIGTDSENRQRSLLSSVQECGAKNGCLPAKQFTWSASGLPAFTSPDLGEVKQDASKDAFTRSGVHVQDLNGDGADDLVYSGGGGPAARADVRLGSRDADGVMKPLASQYTLTDGVSPVGDWPGLPPNMDQQRPVDIDGDGKTEYLVLSAGLDGVFSRIVRWNDAKHEFENTEIKFPFFSLFQRQGQFADVNGDGLLDWVGQEPPQKDLVPTDLPPSEPCGFTNHPDKVYDCPGDVAINMGAYGEPHMVQDRPGDVPKSKLTVRLNQGSGVFTGTAGNTDVPVTATVDPICDTRVEDVDGDGRADILASGMTRSVAQWEQDVDRQVTKWACGESLEPSHVEAKLTRAFRFADDGTFQTVENNEHWQYPPIGEQRAGLMKLTFPGPKPVGAPMFNGLHGWETKLGDFNGDGLLDALLIPTKHDAADAGKWDRKAVILWNTGRGLRYDGTQFDFAHDELADVEIGDMNGDGRDDLVSFYNTALKRKVTCAGFGDADDKKACLERAARPELEGALGYDEIDTTGGQDRIQISYSKGDGSFRADTSMNTSAGVADPNAGRTFSKLGDFNGDGRLDIVKNDGHLRVMTQTAAPLTDRIISVRDEGASWDEVGPVSYSTEWTDRPELMDKDKCAFPLVCVRKGMPVVRKVVSRQGAYTSDDKPRTVLHSYRDPVMHARQGFLGFGVVRAWDPDQPSETVTTYDHRTAVQNHYPLASLPKEVTSVTPIMKSADVPGHPATVKARVTRTVSNYEIRPGHNGGNYAVFPHDGVTKQWDQQVTMHWEENLAGTDAVSHIGDVPDNAPPTVDRQTDTLQQYDDFGNQVDAVSYTIGGAFTHTHTDYDLSDQRKKDWLTGLPTLVTQAAAEGAKSQAEGSNVSCTSTATIKVTCRTTGYEFDGKGRLTVVEQQKNDTDDQVRSKTTYTLDPQLGVPTMATTWVPDRPDRPARVDRVDHIEYTPVFPGQPDEKIYASQTWSKHENAATRPSAWQAVHPAFGVTVATEDVNGVRATVQLDDLGRPVKSSGDGVRDVLTTYGAIHSTDPATLVKRDGLEVLTQTVGGSSSDVITDMAGRTRKATAPRFDGTPVTVTTTYDHLGRQTSASRPFTATDTPKNATTAYDTLNQPLTTTNPDNTAVSWRYVRTPNRDFVDTTDERGNHTNTHIDVHGRPAEQVTLYKKNPTDTTFVGAQTTYHYAPFGLVDKVTDDKGNVTSTVFDVLGRPVKSVDPDRGTTSSTYYGDGLVDTLTHEGTGNKSTFGYDDLGRTTSREDFDAAGKKVTSFVWDAAHGIGKMLKATSPDGIETLFGYDNLSRPSNTLITDNSTGGNGATYETINTYDSAGRPDKLFYPNAPGRPRFTLQSTYNRNDYPVDVNDISTPTSPVTLAHTGQRNNDGALTAGNLGANVRVTNTYDPATGRRTDQFVSNTVSNATLQKLHYTYYDNGLVKTRDQDDTSGKRNEAYRYDEFNRLTGWDLTNNTAAKSTTAYTLDTIGNLTGVANTTGIAPTETRNYGNTTRNAGPHALATDTSPDKTTGTETYTYDKQGRMIQADTQSGTLRKVTYTAFDLPRTIVDMAGKTTTFAYDAFGTRIKKTGSDGTTLTVPGLFDKRTDPAGKTTYTYYIAGVGQAVHDGATTKIEYTLTDQLGSTGTVLDAAGNKTQAFFYDPYGKQTNPDGTKYTGTTPTQTHRFTGQEHDDNLRLINMNGRVYDPYAKTFLTTDPVTANHAYAYVNSNPTNYTDPTGYEPEMINADGSTGYGSAPPLVAPAPLPQETEAGYSDAGPTATCGSNSLSACANNAGSDSAGYIPPATSGMAAEDLYGGASGAGPTPNLNTTEQELQANAAANTLTAPVKAWGGAVLPPLGFAVTVTDIFFSAMNEGPIDESALEPGRLIEPGMPSSLATTNAALPHAEAAAPTPEGAATLRNARGLPSATGTPTRRSFENGINGFGGTENCQCTSQAGVGYLKGRPAMAANVEPTTAARDYRDLGSLSNFFGKPFVPSPSLAKAWLSIARNHPNGTVGIVSGRGKDGAHAFNFRVENGITNFYDFQVQMGPLSRQQIAQYHVAFPDIAIMIAP
ncbi:RHS repeat-associated core domain-containing protein [Streptomyces sp. SKN60]|uniref:RHS repeat-associated core domain-containing protein n=1 Tax=Streptomyces sp. SKN60 TaxID=2855506 RepID=UPI00224581D3|nr:RHS repeat-associated core domain-containing protein [Streptomyces sp. SKN60]